METRKFGARLKELREQAGLSQGELANKVGVNFTYLSKIESGVRPPPSEKVILRLAEVLDADRDELMTLAGKVPSDIAEMLKNRETLQFLRSGRTRKKIRSANKKESFNIRLKELREQAGLSQRELANRVGVSFTYLSKIESGVMPPPSENVIVRLVEVLDADRDELMSLAGKIPSDIAQMLKNRENLQFLRSGRTRKKIGAATKNGGINMMKYLVKYKTLSRVALAIVLVCAVAASLWFTSPLPVKALNIAITDPQEQPLKPGILSQTYYFQVKVSIENYELLPIQSVDLKIFNTANATTYKATCTNLPLINGGTKIYSNIDTGGGGTISVTASAPSWQWGYGYGYAVWEGTPTFFGYGYGYGGVTASITYSIVWTSPAGWPEGGYKIEAKIAANGKTFTQISSEFTLVKVEELPPTVVVVAPGIIDVSGVVASNGVFTMDVTAKSADAKVKLTINRTTIGKTKEGVALSRINILGIEPPALPVDASIVGSTYDLGPDGATFAPPVTITLTYDPAKIPAGVLESGLYLAYWDGTKWVALVSTVDTTAKTLTAKISHFTAFSIIAPVPSVVVAPAALTVSDLSVSSAEVNIGESVTISALVTNTGDLSGTYTVTLKINNVVVDTKDVTLAGGASQTVTFTTSKDTAGTYTVNVDGLSDSFTVKTPSVVEAPAAFTVSALSISPAEVDIGQSVTISALVANTGDLSGTYEVTLKINNVVVDTKDVTLAGGASQTVTFTTSKDVAGTYTVNVDGLSGTFTVKAPPEEEEVPAPLAWWVWLIVGLVVVAVIGVATWLVLKRRRD